jgi:hypothetical protein
LLTDQMFSTGKARHLFTVLRNGMAVTVDSPELTAGLPDEQVQIMEDYAKILVLQYEELYGTANGLSGLPGLSNRSDRNVIDDEDQFRPSYEVNRLQARLIEQYIKYHKQKLTQALATADEATTRRILLEVSQLDALRNQANQIDTN